MKCEICGKEHQKILERRIKTGGKWIWVEEIKSPCLDSISKKAVGLVNNIIKEK